jgi:hypothetical protein
MTALSPIAYLNDPATTESNFQAGIGNLQTFVTELLGGSAAEALTLATDAITPTKAFMVIDTEASASTDNLANIVPTNHPDGRLVAVVSTNSSRVITLKHMATGSGQLDLADDVDAVLDSTDKVILLRRSATGDKWVEVMRNWGVGAVAAADIAALWSKINLRQFWCGTTTGSANTYTATPTISQGTAQAGDTLRFIVNAANTGASTVNGVSITKNGTTALASGDLPINSVATVTHDGTRYQLVGASASHSHTSADVSDFTEAAQDVVGAMVAAAGGSYNDGAGTIAFPAGGGGAWTYISSVAASNSATASFTSGINSTYDMYAVTFSDILPNTTGAQLLGLCSTSGTFGGNYTVSTLIALDSEANQKSASATNATAFIVSYAASLGQSTSSAAGGSGVMFFNKPSSTSAYKRLFGDYTYYTQQGANSTVRCAFGSTYKQTAAMDGIRFYFDSGNIASGTFRLYGIKNS